MRTIKRSVAARCATAFIVPLSIPLLASAQADDWRDIRKPALAPFAVPKPARVVLGNGATVFLMEDRELPLINLTVQLKMGGRDVPAAKTGLAQIFGEVWRTGGTASHTGDELDDLLAAKAASVETWMTMTAGGIRMNCLRADFDAVLATLLEVLSQPAFAEEKIQIAKNTLNSRIARRNEDPDEIAFRESTKLVYGAASPYARVPEYATVAAVTREDLLGWHRKYVTPDRMYVGVSGDFDSKQLLEKVARAFGALPRKPAFTDAPASYQRRTAAGYYLVEKKDVNQAAITMVHLGTTRSNPDFHALEILNEVFGGGISSRLFSNVRSKKGLTYSVHGRVGTGYDYPGLFTVGLDTKSGSMAAAIEALFEEIDHMAKNPPTPSELERAKESILNRFVFKYDTKLKALSEQLTDDFYGYPLDFLSSYRAGIEKVTVADLARVAKSYLHRDQLAVLVVGNPADFDRPLSSFGPVIKLDVAIPTLEANR